MGISSPNAKTHRLVGVAGFRARNWDNGHLARCGRARSPSAPQGGASPPGEPHPYGNSTTTLKNRITAFSAAVAPSTDFHSPSSASSFERSASEKYRHLRLFLLQFPCPKAYVLSASGFFVQLHYRRNPSALGVFSSAAHRRSPLWGIAQYILRFARKIEALPEIFIRTAKGKVNLTKRRV